MARTSAGVSVIFDCGDVHAAPECCSRVAWRGLCVEDEL
jgi:hypothetical protein